MFSLVLGTAERKACSATGEAGGDSHPPSYGCAPLHFTAMPESHTTDSLVVMVLTLTRCETVSYHNFDLPTILILITLDF